MPIPLTLAPKATPAVPAADPALELTRVFTEDRDRLRRIAMMRLDARLAGRVDTDDVLQESYLAAIKRLPHYRSELASMFVWARMVVLQTMTDIARRQFGTKKRGSGLEVSLHADGEAADDDSAGLLGRLMATITSPTRAARRAEQAERLTRRIADLSPVDREILLLRHFEGLGNGEAAAVLGLHKAAATNRYLRALARLQGALGGDDAECADG